MKQSLKEGDILYYTARAYNIKSIVVKNLNNNPVFTIFSEKDGKEHLIHLLSRTYEYKGKLLLKYTSCISLRPEILMELYSEENVIPEEQCFFKTKEEAIDDAIEELTAVSDALKVKVKKLKTQYVECKSIIK